MLGRIVDVEETLSVRDGTLMYTRFFFFRCCSECGRRWTYVSSLNFILEFALMLSPEGMAVDGSDQSDKKPGSVSTHGPRGSRREEWRKSRGLVPIPKRQGMNRQGGLAARRKGGRPSRRR